MNKFTKRNKENRVTVEYDGPIPSNPQHPAQYTIVHVSSGNYYVGSTGNMQQRRWAQMRDLNSGYHSNPNFRELYKPGDEVVFTVKPTTTREEAFALEQTRLNESRGDSLLLNVLEDVHGYAQGHCPSPETREKLASRRGVDHHRHGVKFTEEHRQKIGDAHRGKFVGDETRQRISDSKKGQNAGGLSTLASPVQIAGINYPTVQDAATALGLCTMTVRRRLDNDNMPDWLRVNPKRGSQD